MRNYFIPATGYNLRYSKSAKTKKLADPVYDAEVVWAAAACAQRLNEGYVKEELRDNNDLAIVIKYTNKVVMSGLLATNPQLITDEDRKQGLLVRDFCKGLTFEILRGRTLSDFQRTALVLAGKDTITGNYDLAVIASLPSGYLRGQARENVDERLRSCQGGLVGHVGERVTLDVEVIRQFHSQQYNIFFTTCITEQDQAIFFAYKNPCAAGERVRVHGTVKAHRDNQTQLNRVKYI